MRSMLWKLTLKLKRKPYWVQMMLFYFSSFLIVCCVIPVILIIDMHKGMNTNGPDLTSWILVLILAPIFETFLNQYLPFKLLQKWTWSKNKYGLYIITSAIIFGLMHTYSLQYMVFAFSVGLILGYNYFFYSKTPNRAFWSTTLIHGLRNLFTLLGAFILDNF